jgi:hypothetical protein
MVGDRFFIQHVRIRTHNANNWVGTGNVPSYGDDPQKQPVSPPNSEQNGDQMETLPTAQIRDGTQGDG